MKYVQTLCAGALVVCSAGAGRAQTIVVRDEHPRLVFTVTGSGGTRTFQDVRDLYTANGGANPFNWEFGSWARGTSYSSDPIHEAARFVVTGNRTNAERALNNMYGGSLSYGGTEDYAERGLQWALAYDWIYNAWEGTTPPPGLAAKLADIESKILGWTRGALADLETDGPSLWHGRAAVGAAAWVAALSLPAGNSSHDKLRTQAWKHWQQTLKATHVTGGWDEGPTYWLNNRAILLPLGWESYTTAVASAPALAVPDPLGDLRALGLWQVYTERGDGSFNRYGDVSSAVRISNGTPGRSLDYYARITDDPAMAAFAQHARDYRYPLYYSAYNWMAPVGYDPTQPKPPGYAPADPAACLDEALPNAMVFGPEGLGQVVMRQGWEAGDTQISFKAGDYLAHHGHCDQGTFTIFKHAKLVINSGGYGPYTGVHRLNYYIRTVSKNSILIQRPDEQWTPRGVPPPGGYVNDGGQRIINSTGSVLPSYEYWVANKTSGKNYETGDITAFDNVDGAYSYVASDITRAYNSTLYDSEGQGGKVSLVTRQLAYLQDADVLVIFDRVNSTDPSYKKKWLLHTPNKMIGGTEVVARGSSTNGILEVDGDTIAGDVLTMTNGAGKLFLQVLSPASYTVNKVGGPSYRYYVEDDGDDSDGYDGTNHDDYAEVSWHDYGDWRIELSPKAPARFDTFLNVLWPRSAATSAVAPASMVLDGPVATIMRVGDDVVGFGTTGAIGSDLSYSLAAGGTVRHLLVDLPPGQFVLVGAPDADRGLFVNDAGALCFIASAGGAHDVSLSLLADPHGGDANLDATVNVLDLGALANHYGEPSEGNWLVGDFNGDGEVNVLDLGVLANEYRWSAGGGSAGLTAGAPVPAPAVLPLLALGAVALLRRRLARDATRFARRSGWGR